MIPEPCKPPCGVTSERGAALILTLLVIVLLVVIVTGFLSTTRVEQIAARNYSFQSAAEQMAQLATRQAIAVLRTNYLSATSGIAFATQPGAITVFQGGGSLSSRTLTNFSTGGTATNLNNLVTNGLITASASEAVNVGLLNVTNQAGARLGRYAFYIDDESTKLPVNAAVGDRATINPVFPRPYGVEGLCGFTNTDPFTNGFGEVIGKDNSSFFTVVVDGNGGGGKSSSIYSWANFFSAEQVVSAFGLNRTNLALISPVAETNVAYTTNTPWGSPKVFINTVPFNDVGVDQITSALTNSNLTRIFGQHFGDKYGINNVRQLAANFLQMRGINVFTTNPAVHWPTNGLLGSADLTNPIVAPPDSGEFKKTNGIPAFYLGHAPFPMLTEVAVSAAYGWVSAVPPRLMVKILLECVLLNPYPVAYPGGGLLTAQIDKARFSLSYAADQWRGPEGSSNSVTPHNNIAAGKNDPWGLADPENLNRVVTPGNGVQSQILPNIGARSSTTIPLEFSVTIDEANGSARIEWPNIFVIIDSIKLLANPADPRSIRDWCSGNDFFNALAPDANGPAQFQVGFTGPAPLPTGVNLIDNTISGGPEPLVLLPPAEKIVKVDPRMRPPLAVSTPYQAAEPGRAWTKVPYIAAAPTASSFITATIPADQAFAANPVNALFDTNLPPYLNLSAAGVPTYFSSADLGKVFTGMPWRRVRLQPQPTNESTAQLIPDWVLLDIFSTASPSVPATPVNPNSTVLYQGGSVARPSVGLLSQMGVLTDVSRMSQLGNPMLISDGPVTQLTYASLVATNATRLNAIASNAATPGNTAATPGNTASWSSGSTWAARRSSPLGFPTNVLLLPSEITELAGVADYVAQTNDAAKINEQRLGAIFPGLQTKSRFFTIYALGEAFEGTNANAPVVSQRVLKTLVEVTTNNSPSGVSVDILSQTAPQN